MKKNPLFSIVINNYNYAEYLGACIESALAQKNVKVEIIVVDDGSSDHSLQVIRTYGESVTLIAQKNSGQGSCYNAGFKIARGKIVCFLDADDLLEPTACASIAAVNWSGLSKVQGFLKLINKQGENLGTKIPFNKTQSVDACKIARRFYAYSSPPGSGNFYSRYFLEAVLPMPSDRWKIAADSYLIFRSPFYGNILTLNEVIGFYRIHQASASGVKTSPSINDLMEYAKKEYLKELQRKSLIISRQENNIVIRSVHDTPSLLKLRVLLRISSTKRLYRFSFWMSVFRRAFYIVLFWDYYTLKKRYAFSVWILSCFILPQSLALRFVNKTIYAYRRGY